ncbi:protein OSB1, mitochondrial-like [Quillaja saponaria]|uniref:Protein OSB1, mitochondrial-like n=1 Tax=Quillaja saponaria TaxID=32244 RepID=A0AAD7LH62_QUISA|nr:protein OSB1, mitochondrial-like [Quillaja saponaria]
MSMKVLRLLGLVNKAIPSCQQRLHPFSSHSVANPKLWNSFDDVSEGGSAVYLHALKFQRPTTINLSDMKWRDIEWIRQLENSVSFIGSVARAPQVLNTKTGRFGVYSQLSVRPTSESKSSSFRVLLLMWDRMAEIAFKHLKQNEFIYVSGCLKSYVKDDGSGNPTVHYKVIVKGLNYVAQHGQSLGYQEYEESESNGGEADLETYNNKIYLWQVFFTNPHVWWDCRKRKVNPRQPDFKHKDTGEGLWLNRNDPPWVKRQLQLFDMKMVEHGLGKHLHSHSRVSTWVYDE